MYIGNPQTNNHEPNRRGAIGAPTPPGRTPTLSADALRRAVALNRVYARTIGWMDYTGQIAVRLGITAKNPDIWSFVQALANWQARNGRMPNGILGGEWHDLLTRNR